MSKRRTEDDTSQTKLPRAQQKLKQTSFEIPQEDWDWLNIHCATEGIGKGELMLRLLREYRAKHNKSSPKK